MAKINTEAELPVGVLYPVEDNYCYAMGIEEVQANSQVHSMKKEGVA